MPFDKCEASPRQPRGRKKITVFTVSIVSCTGQMIRIRRGFPKAIHGTWSMKAEWIDSSNSHKKWHGHVCLLTSSAEPSCLPLQPKPREVFAQWSTSPSAEPSFVWEAPGAIYHSLKYKKKSPKSPNSSFSRGSQHRHRYWWRYWSNLERSRCTWWASSSWQLGNWNPTQALQSHKNYWKTKWKCLLLTHKWYKFRAQITRQELWSKKNT